MNKQEQIERLMREYKNITDPDMFRTVLNILCTLAETEELLKQLTNKDGK